MAKVNRIRINEEIVFYFHSSGGHYYFFFLTSNEDLKKIDSSVDWV